MTNKEYKDKIEIFEEIVHPDCDVTVKDIRIEKNIVIADVYLEPKDLVEVNRDCRYLKKRIRR